MKKKLTFLLSMLIVFTTFSAVNASEKSIKDSEKQPVGTVVTEEKNY